MAKVECRKKLRKMECSFRFVNIQVREVSKDEKRENGKVMFKEIITESFSESTKEMNHQI